MGDRADSSQRLLAALERLLRIPTGDLKTTFLQVCDVIAESLAADKVDTFLYEPSRDSLIAISSSNQPLSALQRKLGLEALQLSNGGRVVWVYKTGKTFLTGHLSADPEELRGVKEGLKIESKIGVPLEWGGSRRGMVMIASLKRDFFTEEDARYAEAVVRWVGVLAHRAELAESMRRNAVEQSRAAAAEELVTVVAHDLRNYLTPVELRLHVLRKLAERDARAEMLEELEAASGAAERIRRLVSDLLDVARLQHGVFRLDPASVDLPALLRESAGTLGRPGIEIDVRVQATGQVMVIGDEARLRQCVDNLITNALDKSPPGATVTIVVGTQTRSDGEYASVDVIDEGPGVPPDVLPRIFDRLASGRPREGGLGLGLYLAKRIAELHGGDLGVESSPGKGARFCLRIPCRIEAAGRAERRPRND